MTATAEPTVPSAAAKPARRGGLYLRGERGVAGLGLATAMILIVGVGVSAWLSDWAQEGDDAARQATQLDALGGMLAESAGRLIADNDLNTLRRLAADTAASLDLRTCSICVGGRVAADATPGRTILTTLPPHWTAAAPPLPPGTRRFAFDVPGRGPGTVDLAARPVPRNVTRFAVSASVCAIALAFLLIVYKRSRKRLAELDVVRCSLAAMDAGETAIAALQVDGRLGLTALAWNKLLGEIELLRVRARNGAGPVPGSRRGTGGNLEAACDVMSQGIILVDDKMAVRYANGAACTFLGLDRAKAVGTAAAALIADEKYQTGLDGIATGKQRRPMNLELEQAGEHGGCVLRVLVRPVRRGDPDSCMILVDDVTQQRTAEKARNQFINHVTHELRTPLTNIRLYVETAIEDGEDNAEVRANCLNVINGESRRLERIVSEMLSVAEIEAGSMAVRRDEVYADVLIKDLANDYAAQAKDKGIELVFNVAPKLPKLEADKDKLAVALHNLIGNSLKYTPEGGKVTVTVDVRDGQLAVDVADTGIGIEPAECEKIFERFFRSADPRVGKIVGTGLGLTLAREVMRLHGGDITVKSEINRGSTFTATLPVVMAA